MHDIVLHNKLLDGSGAGHLSWKVMILSAISLTQENLVVTLLSTAVSMATGTRSNRANDS